MRKTDTALDARFGPYVNLAPDAAGAPTSQLEALRRRLPMRTQAWERLAVEAALCDLAEGHVRAGDLLRR